ncbi:metal ABC transporter substrate-binding protein [Rahnella sp. PAMC25617]|uniref:metal ABC transporter substrate-binding protein n=1 Tax=Rahnella TaxID=34037 RepID=UPI000DD3DB61|nr:MULTISPECIES: metal ABC transporter substrate-binding protein [Rahnella]MDH2894912.1 metal ABC transporter substrate-binding protein [Rahnella variigena]RBQ36163.1 metal ABC transporter substrate-binding protein [Rahnella aquatilis]TCQ90544.1 zinc/manganese transport system substrate-binding protein [Rahnella sp. JUb53]
MKVLPVSLAAAALLSSPLAMAKTVDAVASFSILGDIVQEVGGEHVKVTTLVGPDGDPHSFEPSPKDSKAINASDVVFVSGLGLEGWIDRLVTASGYKGHVVTASEGVNSRKMEEDGKQITDPHAWNSMANGVIYATNVMNALIKADPEDADYFRQRGTAYIEQLQKLDAWAKTEFTGIPQSKRKVLTSHDAFGYFGQEYHVSFMAPVGFSTEAEASASGVASLIKQIKEEKVKTYFIENQTDPRLVKQIAAASGAQPGGELYPEALSGPQGPATTYIKAFKHNVETIVASMK